MKGLAVKGTVGLLGATGLSLGGYYGYPALNKGKEIDIENKLKKEKYTLLKSGNKHFNAILNSYKNAIRKSDALKFEGFEGIDENGKKAEDILLERCQDIFKNKKISEEDYSKAKRWCVEPVSVSELLRNNGFNSLSTIASSDGADNAKWEDKIRKYRSSTNLRIDNLKFTSSGDTTPTGDEINNIKIKCNGIKDIKNHDDKFDVTLKAFKAWCTG